ncbi:hypothetical protein CCR75_006607 [Bremia lactucae]|uniref:FAD-binding FR-type domain-containing protein n=1 Tax=Bremia lactucae TaxID=4779 RepID=A0A976FII2_BRELC|nr:hypothetical protein CCR75_006607 [Bremia lactucae]
MRTNSKRNSRAISDSKVTLKTDYNCFPVLEGIETNSFSWSSHAPNVPILDLERQGSTTYNVEDSANTKRTIQELYSQPRRPHALGPLKRYLRSWKVFRWKLSRSFFGKTVPLLTTATTLTLGDVLITLPISGCTILYTFLQALNYDVATTGQLATIALALVFGFAIRNNAVLLLCTGIPFERALVYHKLAACVTIGLTGLHGFAYVSNRRKHEQSNASFHLLTGLIAFFALVLLHFLSLKCIRQAFFQLFVHIHWILILIVMVCAILHGATNVVFGVTPWAIDILYRFAYRSQRYAHGDSCNLNNGVIARNQLSICALPGNITRIQFPRVRQDTGETFVYEAGQYAFLCIPSISCLEWHPFTIASSPHEAMVTFYVKALGKWTTKLLSVALKREASAMRLDGPSSLTLFLDGPYGALSLDLVTPSVYSHVVLFSDGIAMTPMRSIVNWLHHECFYRNRGAIPHVRFIWSVKEMELINSLLARDEPRRDSCLEVDEVASYFPHILSHPLNTNQASDSFVSEIYFVRDIMDEDALNLPELVNCLHIGLRPDAIAILREMGEEAKNNLKDRVAVLVSGSPALVEEVVYASVKLAKELRVHFDVHQETPSILHNRDVIDRCGFQQVFISYTLDADGYSFGVVTGETGLQV